MEADDIKCKYRTYHNQYSRFLFYEDNGKNEIFGGITQKPPAKKRGRLEEEMNKVILMGRLTRDPEVRYSQGEKPWLLQDISWPLTVECAEARVMNRQLILSAV